MPAALAPLSTDPARSLDGSIPCTAPPTPPRAFGRAGTCAPPAGPRMGDSGGCPPPAPLAGGAPATRDVPGVPPSGLDLVSTPARSLSTK